jgi:HSP20 family protein
MTSTLRRYDPFRNVATLQDEIDRAFRSALGSDSGTATAGAWSPALDVEESQDAFTLHVELPGVASDDVDVSLEENVLTIQGERRFYDESEADGFRRIERHFGRFHRSIRLPDRVDPDAVKATAKDGLLTIVVPKAEEAKPRRIAIESA